MNHVGLLFVCLLLGMTAPAADRPISAPAGDGTLREAGPPVESEGPRSAAESEGPWTAVVFGVKGDKSEDYNAPAAPWEDHDLISQILVTADWQAGRIRLASVRTELVVADDSFESGYGTLGEIYRDSGPEVCMEALNRNLDADAEDYFVVPWAAAADAVNILGGIDIELTEDERWEYNARLTEVVAATGIGTFIPKNGGLLHMDGVQAVAYMNLASMDLDTQYTSEEKAERRHRVSEQVLRQAASAGLMDVKTLLEVVEPQIDTSLTTGDFLTIMSGCRMVTSIDSVCIPRTYRQGEGEKSGGIFPDTLEDSAVLLNSFLYDNPEYACPESVLQISRELENADIS